MGRSQLVDALADVAERYAFSSHRESETRLSVYWPGFARLLIEATESGALMVAIYVRSSSGDWPGDRTDLNELFAILIAVSLHDEGVSVSQVLVEHPVLDLPGEVYASYLIPKQPYSTGFPGTLGGVEQLRRFIVAVSLTHQVSLLVLQVCGWERGSEGTATTLMDERSAEQVSVLRAVLGVDKSSTTWIVRETPSWLFHRTDSGVTVFSSRELCHALITCCFTSTPDSFEGPTGTVLKRDRLLNYVDRSVRSFCEGIFGAMGDEVRRVVAIEDRVIVVGDVLAVSWPIEAGRSVAVDERRRIGERHASEHALLFDESAVVWSDPVNPARFEELVRALLEQEPGVRRARPAGSASEPDGGRDLLVEWETPLLPAQLDPESPSATHCLRRVVVQCKADRGAVGTNRVFGVSDTLDHFQADGYVLVVRSRLTRPLVDRLDQRRALGKIWVDWWTGLELEQRLREHRHIAEDFSDIVRVEAKAVVSDSLGAEG